MGLSSKDWGRFTLGRHNTLMIEWMSKYNPFDNANSIKRPDPAFSDRSDNTAMYVGKFGPVSVGAYCSFWLEQRPVLQRPQPGPHGRRRPRQIGRPGRRAAYHGKNADKPKTGADSGNREDRVIAALSMTSTACSFTRGYRWLEQKLARRLRTT